MKGPRVPPSPAHRTFDGPGLLQSPETLQKAPGAHQNLCPDALGLAEAAIQCHASYAILASSRPIPGSWVRPGSGPVCGSWVWRGYRWVCGSAIGAGLRLDSRIWEALLVKEICRCPTQDSDIWKPGHTAIRRADTALLGAL